VMKWSLADLVVYIGVPLKRPVTNPRSLSSHSLHYHFASSFMFCSYISVLLLPSIFPEYTDNNFFGKTVVDCTSK